MSGELDLGLRGSETTSSKKAKCKMAEVERDDENTMGV